MNTIVRDDGFHKDDWAALGGTFVDLEKYGQDVAEKTPEQTCLDIPNNLNVDTITGLFDQVAMIRIPFPSFADGRGFSLAKRLRQLGYDGRLRALGHVIADQYGYARTCGFDEIEIDDAMSVRQPEEQWIARLPNPSTSYQKRLLAERELRNH